MIRRAALWSVITLGVLCLLLLIGLFLGQRALIYPAPRGATLSPPSGFATVRFDTEDGLRLAGAYRAASRGRSTILFFHGNGDSLAGAAEATRYLAAAGYGVLLVEYRGYAGNPGRPSEAGLRHDGRAALAWLGRHGVAPTHVVIVGNSLGSGVATALAAEQPTAGLVLVSGFTSMTDVAASLYPWLPVRQVLLDRFDNRAKLTKVAAPILLLHGTADRLIPARHSVALSRVGKRTTLGLVPGAGHDLAYTPEAQTMIIHWLERMRAKGAPRD